MKLIVSIILTALLSYAACLFLPWWSIAIAAFLVALTIGLRPGYAFLAGFTGVFILWALISYTISLANGHLLAGKVSMLILKTENPLLLIVLSALIGALTAGMGALTGAYGRQIFFEKKKSTLQGD